MDRIEVDKTCFKSFCIEFHGETNILMLPQFPVARLISENPEAFLTGPYTLHKTCRPNRTARYGNARHPALTRVDADRPRRRAFVIPRATNSIGVASGRTQSRGGNVIVTVKIIRSTQSNEPEAVPSLPTLSRCQCTRAPHSHLRARCACA